MRLHDDVIETAAGEDPAVTFEGLAVGFVQPRRSQVEGIGILHDELPHAEQAALGTKLVAELGLDLIPDLRELLVAAQFATGDACHDLFVRHAEAQGTSEAIFQSKQIVAHPTPAAGPLPYLSRVERR